MLLKIRMKMEKIKLKRLEMFEEVMKADLKTLPADVYEELSEDKIDECAEMLVTKMAKKT